MSLYRVTTDKFEPVSRTTFAAESLLERKDIQRLLKQDVGRLADLADLSAIGSQDRHSAILPTGNVAGLVIAAKIQCL